jgi:hypothetical protein
MSQKTEAVIFRTSPEIKKSLVRVAESDQRTVAGLCSKIITDWLAANHRPSSKSAAAS